MRLSKIASTARPNGFFGRLTSIFGRFVALAAFFFWSVAAYPASAVEAGEAAVVGKVSLVLGKAYLLREGKPRKLVEIGSQIRASDQILTQSNGHVHIRFVDEALVSVRPDSQLEIISYDYDSEHPEKSLIKMNLKEGVARSISGAGAKAARSRYRLNTPIAAIGVRGTDFVVSVTDQSTRALVNQGAIVMAPYSEECTVSAIGPCATNAVELTDSALQMLEFEGTALVPRLIPAPHEREPGIMREEVQLALADNTSEDEGRITDTDAYLENVTSLRATKQAVDDLPEFTPAAAVASSELTNRQMVWGRWASEPSAQERITLNFEEARVGRKVTVGNSEYALFRVEGPRPQVERGLGPVSFSLASAQAFYNSESGIVAMQVNRGNLAIDFDQSSFTTELNLNHISTGFVDFAASGTISDRGYFNAIADTQRLAGAVTTDGREAGYFFEKQLENGSVNGLTLWDAR
ncbi:MAG: FecR domain-containing protein [Gammaproteobacteria bacterium]|nr:FecR domain-containing protein [Gammaproteobacteria bacterium]